MASLIRLVIQMQILSQFWKDHKHPHSEPQSIAQHFPATISFYKAPNSGGSLRVGIVEFLEHFLLLLPPSSVLQGQRLPQVSNLHTLELQWTPSPACTSPLELHFKGDRGQHQHLLFLSFFLFELHMMVFILAFCTRIRNNYLHWSNF